MPTSSASTIFPLNIRQPQADRCDPPRRAARDQAVDETARSPREAEEVGLAVLERFQKEAGLAGSGPGVVQVGGVAQTHRPGRAQARALAVYRELGDRRGEGAALNNLGIALRDVRRFEEAIDAHFEGLAICRELGDRHSEGTVRTAWAVAHNNAG
ncbi:tetratricopeptide repeat protein [Streptomyces sp900105755]|uniref:Tetratricopeptide repeat protein n=1 Tax=Streptomyces sp. 900105755 TaxID=3154389 RepID=A0ABV1TXG3_9ACTN